MAGASMQCELGKLEEVLSLQGPKLEFLPKMWLRTRRRKCLALGDCKASLLGSKPIQTRTCQTTQSYGYFAAYYRVVREAPPPTTTPPPPPKEEEEWLSLPALVAIVMGTTICIGGAVGGIYAWRLSRTTVQVEPEEEEKEEEVEESESEVEVHELPDPDPALTKLRQAAEAGTLTAREILARHSGPTGIRQELVWAIDKGYENKRREAAKKKAMAEAEWKECFDLFDKDSDGKIQAAELGEALRSLGLVLTQKEVSEMKDEVGGDVSWEKFKGLVAKRPRAPEKQEPHFVCDGCLQSLAQSCAQAAVYTQRRREGRIQCPVPSCNCAPYSHQALAAHLTHASFDAYLQAMFKVVEAEALASTAFDTTTEWVELLRRHVVEDILTFKCQACGQAFVDFDGCFALRCSRCHAGLCAWCGKSCENQTVAHDHVRSCPFAPHQDQLYGSQEQFQSVSRERRLERLNRFLTTVERGTRHRLLSVLQKDLEDLGHTAEQTSFLHPRRPRKRLWLLLAVFLPLGCLLLTLCWRHPTPSLPEVLADAEEYVKCYLGAARAACRLHLLKLWSDVQDIGFEVLSASPQGVPGQPTWQWVLDELLFLPFRMQIIFALATALVVAFCAGLPVALLGLLLEMEVVQHFLRWCYFRGGRWLHFFRGLPADPREPHSFRKFVEQRGELARKAAETGHLKATQVWCKNTVQGFRARARNTLLGQEHWLWLGAMPLLWFLEQHFAQVRGHCLYAFGLCRWAPDLCQPACKRSANGKAIRFNVDNCHCQRVFLSHGFEICQSAKMPNSTDKATWAVPVLNWA
ncbi:unnamed protein product [Durusdinium trenchii]|uniref:Flagellar (CAM-1) n=2 Tax=Durusdinium trenchii TaxID=1381693 RepID=A0ABP0R571_9DINO